MLDSNEYNGLSDFETKELAKVDDGNIVYEGVWKDIKKQELVSQGLNFNQNNICEDK